MKKSLYSLMLSDEVVREIDVAAHRLGTNRSALINRILAEYASVTTPEKRINDIFSSICNFFGGGVVAVQNLFHLFRVHRIPYFYVP